MANDGNERTFTYQFEILHVWKRSDGEVMMCVRILNLPPTAKFLVHDMTWEGHTQQCQKRATEKGMTLDEWIAYVNREIASERSAAEGGEGNQEGT